MGLINTVCDYSIGMKICNQIPFNHIQVSNENVYDHFIYTHWANFVKSSRRISRST